MNESAPVRDSWQCSKKQALIEQALNFIDLISSIHNEELDAVFSREDTTRGRYLNRLREAHERKALLIEMLRRHIGLHGC